MQTKKTIRHSTGRTETVTAYKLERANLLDMGISEEGIRANYDAEIDTDFYEFFYDGKPYVGEWVNNEPCTLWWKPSVFIMWMNEISGEF